MSDPYIFDVNTYIQADAAITELAGGTIPIYPLVGYEQTVAPFILYWWMPGIFDVGLYGVNVDSIRYHILDTDAERGFKLQRALKNRLNKADNIQGQIASSEGRALWCIEMLSGTGAFNAGLGSPGEREGFYEFQLNFQIGYAPLAQTIEIGGAGESDD
jgi:hypothetical protein